MQTFKFPSKNKKVILALGAESAGNFSVHIPSTLLKRGVGGGLIYFSRDFGDLLNENNFHTFQKAVLDFLKKNKIKPQVIITDLHPLMKTTLWGRKLAKKYKARFIQVQHHHAHIFSAIGDNLIKNLKNPRTVDREPKTIYGITMDGTGYGTDEKIWGGEVFQLRTVNRELRTMRIGSLENQILLGGELAIQEPARMIISILSKFSSKKEIYPFVKKYYSKNEFELLYNQLEQNFNCIETSSTGRVLDAVSLLLGFCNNERKYKHEATSLLETNSTKPYADIKPKIIKTSTTRYELQTTFLFKYLIKNIHKNKKRLAATVQLYIAKGLRQIIKLHCQTCHPCLPAGRLAKCGDLKKKVILSGGIANNKIIKNYFISQKLLENKKNHVPKGDAGLSFGQITLFLLDKQI